MEHIFWHLTPGIMCSKSFMKKMRCTNEHMSRLIRLWTTWNFPRSTFLGWQCALPIRQVLWEVEVVFVIISNMYKYKCKCKNKHYTGCGREGGAHQGRVPMEGRDWTVESQFLGSRGPLRVPLAPSRPFPQQKFLLLQCHLYLPPWATQPLPLLDVDMDNGHGGHKHVSHCQLEDLSSSIWSGFVAFFTST